MRDLKDNSTINERNNKPSFKEQNQQLTHSKKEEMASKNNGGQQQNIEIINIISYLEQTTEILITTRYQSDPVGHVINLSEKTSTKSTYQLLNKNLNFIPTININIQ